MTKEKRMRLMAILDKVYPLSVAPLRHESAYQLLVAVILSAQCTDERVNKITPGLFEVAGTPLGMVELGLERLVGIIRSCGYYNSKAKHILRMSELLMEKYDGEVPSTLEELVELPGVGVKTASCILTQWYKKPGIAVDTHYFRVANRTGLARGKTPEAVYKKSLEVLPMGTKVNGHDVSNRASLKEGKKSATTASHSDFSPSLSSVSSPPEIGSSTADCSARYLWLDGSLSMTLHGRYTCLAKKPKCGECVIYELCEWKEKA